MFWRIVCLSVLSVLAWQVQSKASDEKEQFWVITNPEYPFIAVDDKRKLSGYAVEVVKGILKRADMEQEILTAPWARVEKEAQTKANVLIFALARTPNREDLYHWITPITANVMGIYTNRAVQASIGSLEDVNSLGPIGVLNGDVRHQLLQAANVSQLRAYESWGDTIKAMLAGEINSVFFSEAGVAYFCLSNQWNCQDVKRILLYQQTQSYLAVSKSGTKPEFVARLKTAASEFKASQDYQTMAKYWLNMHRQQTQLPMHVSGGILNLWEQ